MTISTCTISELLDFVTAGRWKKRNNKELIKWPPDVFAMAGCILRRSGGYYAVAESENWPPRLMTQSEWSKFVRHEGKKWERSFVDSRVGVAPPSVVRCWANIHKYATTLLRDVSTNEDLWQSLVELCAIPDESCSGVGVPPTKVTSGIRFRSKGPLQQLVSEALRECLFENLPATLCRAIDSDRLLVLPKLHTPINGITFRSLSHNLSLIDGGGVNVRWVENAGIKSEDQRRAYGESVNILVVPWPFTIDRVNFRPTKLNHIHRLAPRERFFEYQCAPTDVDFPKRIAELVTQSSNQIGPIDALVFPELAFSQEQYMAVRDEVFKLGLVRYIVCGVSSAPTKSRHGENYAMIAAASSNDRESLGVVESRQEKHHRWFLEKQQIRRYGLSATLDPGQKWWESTSLKPRALTLVAAEPWLTFTVLICEDLARPDPVGEVVRAIGPNLVIALLLDGPQLRGRWSERCASVLADDPGSSVLSVTSLGMTQLSEPPQGEKPSRSIALWKDRSGLQMIELPVGAEAVVLSLSNVDQEEWTADGRGDKGVAGELQLVGIRPVFPKKSLSILPVSNTATTEVSA